MKTTTITRNSGRLAALLLSSVATLAMSTQAQAQDADADETVASDSDTIVVSGIRATLQNSIDTKRNSIEILDALSADEVGDLPALSIGEALETLTGAASHREQGGATEIAIRGLGPFLSSTTINGRIATNGSGDRSVNFSQFPSELFSKVGIYKTQSASLIEGGVAGQIILETVRPLDYGKRRIQGEVKLAYNPDNLNIDEEQRFQTHGYRAALSYIDQFELGDMELGISLGYALNDSTNPEQEANASTNVHYCRNVPGPSGTGGGVYDEDNCGTDAVGRPDTAGTEPFLIGHSSYTLVQNITDDRRDAVFGAVQFKPTPAIDINFDVEYSNRTYRERRNDLNFSEGRRIDGVGELNGLNYPLLSGPFGELFQFTQEGAIEIASEYITRDEEYIGGGLSLDFEVSDRLTLSADASYSRTERIEESVEVRLRIRDQQNIFGEGGQYPLSVESDGNTNNDRIENAILIQQNGSQGLNFVVQQFDVNNYELFHDAPRVRADLEQKRFNEIYSGRADFEYQMDGWLSSIEGGVRYQNLVYRDVPGASGPNRIEVTSYSDAAVIAANQACRTAFPESNFLSSVSGGNALVTNVDADENIISTTNTFATFDALCLAQTLEATSPSGQITFDDNGIPIYPDGSVDSIANTDMEEVSWAGYLQANFDGELGSTPVSGNFGLRVVNTKVTSNGFRGTLTAVFGGPNGELTNILEDENSLFLVTGGGSYTKFLPSVNVVVEAAPDVLVRGAVFRALSRPDPSQLGFGRTFDALSESDPIFTIGEAVGSASATGNPNIRPLMSWNGDVALEWYPDADSILAVGAYYKRFNGGFETVGRFETFTVDGQDLRTLVSTVDTTQDSTSILGFEVTAGHRFSYLPAPLDGLGFKLSYNYADSDFEFQDKFFGAVTTVNPDGSTSVSETLVPPASLFGLSKHVLSAQVYYEIGELSMQGVYKYRSDYFQQFVGSDPARIRYVDSVGVFEARVSYNVARNVRLSLEGLNLFNSPRLDYRLTKQDFLSVSTFGPRFFAGVRAKF